MRPQWDGLMHWPFGYPFGVGRNEVETGMRTLRYDVSPPSRIQQVASRIIVATTWNSCLGEVSHIQYSHIPQPRDHFSAQKPGHHILGRSTTDMGSLYIWPDPEALTPCPVGSPPKWFPNPWPSDRFSSHWPRVDVNYLSCPWKKWIHWCPQCVSKSPGLIGVQVLQVAHAFCLSNARSFDFSLRSFNGFRPWWSRIAHWWGPRQPFHQRQSLPINCWCVVHPSLPERAMKIGKQWQTYQTIELWWVDNGWCGWSFSQVPWGPKKTHIGMSRVRSGIQLNLCTWLHLCARRNTKASPCAMAYISLQQVASAFMKWHQYWWNCNEVYYIYNVYIYIYIAKAGDCPDSLRLPPQWFVQGRWSSAAIACLDSLHIWIYIYSIV